MTNTPLLKVCVAVPHFPRRSETFIVNKVRGLTERGVKVRVLAHSPPEAGAFGGDLAWSRPLIEMAPGLGMRQIPFASLKDPSAAPRLWREAVSLYGNNRRALRATLQALPFASGQGTEILHFEFSGLAVQYLDALPLLKDRVQIVVSCRGGAEKVKPVVDKSRVGDLAKTLDLADRIHCVSEEMRRTISDYGVDIDKAFVNPPSIDISIFEPTPRTRPSEALRVSSTGSLRWVKGYPYALVALRELKDQGVLFNYRIIGEGPEEEHLRFLIHQFGLEEYVTLMGGVGPRQVKAVLEETDVFLLPSLSEGLSNAVLEAMAMGLPVISTNVGGMPEAFTDGKEGFFVAPYSSREIATRVLDLASDPELRTKMGAAGRKRVEAHFNLDDQIDRFIQEYGRRGTSAESKS